MDVQKKISDVVAPESGLVLPKVGREGCEGLWDQGRMCRQKKPPLHSHETAVWRDADIGERDGEVGRSGKQTKRKAGAAGPGLASKGLACWGLMWIGKSEKHIFKGFKHINGRGIPVHWKDYFAGQWSAIWGRLHAHGEPFSTYLETFLVVQSGRVPRASSG